MKTRIAAVGALTGCAVLLVAGPASAHVTVQPTEAQQGSYSKLVFKVPTERDNASTTKLEVDLPADSPIASVQTEPVPGWDVQVHKSKLPKPITTDDGKVTDYVSQIVWSKGKIAPGQFQEFPISVGPLPDNTDKLVFKALQTYSSGEVVRWIQETKAGQDEPPNPAPVVTLTKAAAAADGSTATPAASGAKGPDAGGGSTQAASADSSDGTARTLGIVGIVVGVVGAAVGVFGLRRRAGTPSA
jgi:uncharacterized protein YcnI